jgi:hypothetical protein
MKLLSITPSDKPEKKLKAVFETDAGRKKTTHFGAKNMDDYTITKDKEQRARYLQRHKARENWTDPTTAGALSRAILWGDSTSRQTNIATFKKRFNL